MPNILDASKSNLGKLLASENIRIEHQKVAGPYFDVKDRVLVLPIWKDMDADLYDLFIGHEVGHALFTPSEGWLDDVKEMGGEFKTFLNIVEDARIEKKMKRKYPGLRKPMYSGYTQLVEKKFFGVTMEEMKFMPFIDRLNVHFKLGARSDVSFNMKEQNLVDRIDNCEEWDEVVALAKELYAMAKDEKTELDDMFDDLMEALENDSFSDSSMSDGESMSEEDFNKKVADVVQRLREQGKNSMADALEKASHQAKQQLREWLENSEPSSITNDAYQKNEESLLDEKALPISYVKWPKVDVSKWVIPHAITHKNMEFNEFQEGKRNKIYSEFMALNKRYVNYLVKEFELRRNAKQFAKAKVSKTGKLDVNKIWKYKISEDLFLQSTVVPNGKNHGMLMSIDMSASMGNNIAGTIEQVISLAMFCRKVSIPFEVYGFTDNAYHEDDYKETNISNDVVNRNIVEERALFIPNYGFRMKQMLTHTMKLHEFNRAVQNLLLLADSFSSNKNYYTYGYSPVPNSMSLSGTPLNESIVVLAAIAEEFKKNTNIEILNTIILTDGDASYGLQYCVNGEHTPLETYNHRVIMEYGQHQVNYSRSVSRLTTDLLTMYKNITNSRVIGIYLMDGSYKNEISRRVYSSESVRDNKFEEQYKNEFLKNRFFGVTMRGYDVYYMVPGTDLEIQTVNMDSVIRKNTENSKSNLLKAFKKMQNNKMISRVFLNQFIKHIS